MKTEYCPRCHNTVVGEFSPSGTRKWLTALAKKGGMKAVLTAAGSVIPGFGNVAGFVAGTALDVIYGNDINKAIDNVADLFDDNKVYVFTCPQCGHTWTRKANGTPNLVTETTSVKTDGACQGVEIYNKMRKIIAEKLCIDEDQISLSSRLQQDLGADSLDSVELIMEFEKEFMIEIPDSEAKDIHTVGDIYYYLESFGCIAEEDEDEEGEEDEEDEEDEEEDDDTSSLSSTSIGRSTHLSRPSSFSTGSSTTTSESSLFKDWLNKRR